MNSSRIAISVVAIMLFGVVTRVCTKNLNADVVMMKSAKDGV